VAALEAAGHRDQHALQALQAEAADAAAARARAEGRADDTEREARRLRDEAAAAAGLSEYPPFVYTLERSSWCCLFTLAAAHARAVQALESTAAAAERQAQEAETARRAAAAAATQAREEGAEAALREAAATRRLRESERQAAALAEERDALQTTLTTKARAPPISVYHAYPSPHHIHSLCHRRARTWRRLVSVWPRWLRRRSAWRPRWPPPRPQVGGLGLLHKEGSEYN